MAAPVGEAFVVIRPLTTGFSKELEAQLKTSLGATGKALGGTLEKELGGAGANIGSALGKTTPKIEQETAKWGGSLKRFDKTFENVATSAEHHLTGLTKSSGLLSGVLGDLGASGAAAAPPVLAGVAAIGALTAVTVGGIEHFVALTDQVRKFSIISGASAEESSRFVAALNVLGVSSESFGRALFQMSKRIETGQLDLASFGAQTARNADGSVRLTETVLNIADAFKNNSSAADRNNLAFQAFGRQGLALIPVLARGREGLEEFFKEADKNHVVFSDADIEKGREFGIATRELQHAFEALEIQLGEQVVPTLISVANAMTAVIQKVNDLSHNSLIKLGFGALKTAAGLGAVGDAVNLVGGHSSKASREVAAAAEAGLEMQSAFESATAASVSLQTAQDALSLATDHLNGTAITHIDFQKRVSDAQAVVTEKTQLLRFAQERLNAIGPPGAHNANALAAANKEVADASTEAEKAVKALTAAEEDEAQRIDRVIEATTQIGELQAAVKDDTASLKDAQENLSEAQKKLSALSRVNGADLEKQAEATRALRDSELRLAEARQGILDAAVNLRDKQLQLGKAIDEFGPQSIEAAKAGAELQDAQLGQRKATEDVTNALDAHNKAQKDLQDASPGSEAAQKRLADAQHAVDAATRSVEGAVRALAHATSDYAVTQDAANGHVDTAVEKALHLRDAYAQIAATLAPDSALRKNITDTAAAIASISQAQAIVAGQAGLGPGGNQGQEDAFARGVARGTAPTGRSITINVFPAQGQSEAATAQMVSNAIAFQSGPL